MDDTPQTKVVWGEHCVGFLIDKFIEYCYIFIKPTNLLGIRSDE